MMALRTLYNCDIAVDVVSRDADEIEICSCCCLKGKEIRICSLYYSRNGRECVAMNGLPDSVCQHKNGGHRPTLSHWIKFHFHICYLVFVNVARFMLMYACM
jgi:hypothetical protein